MIELDGTPCRQLTLDIYLGPCSQPVRVKLTKEEKMAKMKEMQAKRAAAAAEPSEDSDLKIAGDWPAPPSADILPTSDRPLVPGRRALRGAVRAV